MGMNMAGEHCPNCGHELEDGQIGLCEACGGDHLSNDEAGERCPACNELRDETANSTHQQWECCACGSWNDKATHGSPELDADARKLEAMGLSAGAAMADVDPVRMALVACVGIIEALSMAVVQNQEAWEGEEDSVQEEHAELMERNRLTIAAHERFAHVLTKIAGGAHVDGE